MSDKFVDYGIGEYYEKPFERTEGEETAKYRNAMSKLPVDWICPICKEYKPHNMRRWYVEGGICLACRIKQTKKEKS